MNGKVSHENFLPVRSDKKMKEAIHLLTANKKDCLLVDGEFILTKDMILEMYSKQIPLDTTLNDALKENDSFSAFENELLSKIIEALPYSLCVIDSDGYPIFVNDAFIQSTGLSKEEVLTHNVIFMEESEILSPAITPIVVHEKRTVSIDQQLKNGQDTIVTGIPIFHEDNSVRWVVTISQEAQVEKYFSVKKELKESDKNFIYKSEKMKELVEIVKQVANVDSTVMLSGESGVGKDMIARLIHQESERSDSPFIQLNCGAIPESLLESELFGYEPGAFSGADKKGKKGLIEAAHSGTLFLDEIGEMSLQLQVKLLQVMQNREIIRVGGTKPIKVNVRVISATNRNLHEDVQKGLFRLDLFYRLNVIPMDIPPLRERPEDILPLSYYFLDKFNKKYNKQFQLTLDIEKVILDSSWPGNIRELENFIERLVVLNRNPTNLLLPSAEMTNARPHEKPIVINELVPLKEAIEMVEEELLKKAANIENNSYKIAALLKISQSSAHRKMQKYLAGDRKEN